MVVQFRACPRCQGDLNAKGDMWGEYRVCMQCGFFQDIEPKPREEYDWVKTRGKPGRKRKQAA